MICCGQSMEKLFKTARGRWEKQRYKCSVCGKRENKRIKLIGYVKGEF